MIKAFFMSWQGNIRILILLAVCSAALITFYTTNLSPRQSLFTTSQGITFIFSFISMLFAVTTIAICIYWLDHKKELYHLLSIRWMVQLGLLCIFLPVLTLQIVYFLYDIFFQIDLRNTNYSDWDFEVLIGCIILIQFYFEIRKQYQHRTQLANKISELENQLIIHKGQISELSICLNSAKKMILATDNALIGVQKRLNYWQNGFEELHSTLEISIESKILLISISEICYLQTDRQNVGAKIIYACLNDGRIGMVNGGSLNRLSKAYPILTLRISRFVLLFQCCIDRVEQSEDNNFYVHFLGTDIASVQISEEFWIKIRKGRRLFEKIMWEYRLDKEKKGIPRFGDTTISKRSVIL